MTRLILTAGSTGLEEAGRTDIEIPLISRFVWGPLPSDDELAEILAPRTSQRPGSQWLDYASSQGRKKIGGRELGLIELCRRCETVGLWMGTEPNAQLVLIWLLDYLHSHADAAIIEKLVLCHVDVSLGGALPAELARWKFPAVGITNEHFEIATLAWQAYRAPTPQPWFNLLNKDLSVLPQLRRCVLELLEELPGRATGLGASELRILELISSGYWHWNDLRPLYRERFQRRVFNEWEFGMLLEGLAHGLRPAVAGLDDELRTIEKNSYRGRHEAYRRSRLSLTEFGKAILAHQEDFSRHNPIDRWWGGTRLTNDRLWRWDPVLIAPQGRE